MVYLVATLATDSDHMPTFLESLGSELDVPPPDPKGESWAVGYYADDRPLIIQKPSKLISERSVHGLAPQVRSRIVLACARPKGQVPVPYRFHRWLFAHTGDLEPLTRLKERILDGLPGFVRTEVGAEASGGQLAFGMFLAELHKCGYVDDPLIEHPRLGATLHKTVETIESLLLETTPEGLKAAFTVTNGRAVVASTRRVPLYWRLQEGLEGPSSGTDDVGDVRELATALKRFRAWVVTENVRQERGWRAMDSGQTISLDGQLDIQSIAPSHG